MGTPTRHRLRRQAATPGMSLMNPLFNLREIVKQLLLIEDHMLHPEKRCGDCISKHLLTSEALADEAIALDVSGIHDAVVGNLASQFRGWAVELLDSGDYRAVGQKVRRLRKTLTPLVFDPRGKEATDRVASTFLAKAIHRVG